MKRTLSLVAATLLLMLVMTGCTRSGTVPEQSIAPESLPNRENIGNSYSESRPLEDLETTDDVLSDYEADVDGMVEDSEDNDTSRSTTHQRTTDNSTKVPGAIPDTDTDNSARSRAGRTMEDAADGIGDAVRGAGNAINDAAEGTMDAVDDMMNGRSTVDNDAMRVPNYNAAA